MTIHRVGSCGSCIASCTLSSTVMTAANSLSSRLSDQTTLKVVCSVYSLVTGIQNKIQHIYFFSSRFRYILFLLILVYFELLDRHMTKIMLGFKTNPLSSCSKLTTNACFRHPSSTVCRCFS